MKTVVICDASSYKAIVVAKAIAACSGVRVLGVDGRRLISSVHSRWFAEVSPVRPITGDGADFCEDLAGICQRYNASHLLPINSEEMRVLLPRRRMFGTLLADWGSHDSFMTLDNKSRLHDLAASIGIRVPKQALDRSSLAAMLPVVLKPVESSSSKGVRYIHSISEVSESDIEGIRTGLLVAQEMVHGDGLGLSVLCQQGEVVAYSGHLRLAEWPASGGSSTIREYYFSEEMIEVAKVLTKKSCWSGLAMFEFKRTTQGELFLIECNPRVWGSIGQSMAAGVNFPVLFFGLPASVQTVDRQARTKLSPMCWASIASYAVTGRSEMLIRSLRAVFRAEPDVGIWSDPGGYLSMLVRPFLSGSK